MKRLLSCEFNFDTVCVELKFSDGTMIAIDTIAVENEVAINQINKDYVRDVCLTARDTKNVRAVSFNFHTPYPDTKELALTKEEKAKCCDTITQMMKEGAPVFNLKSAFPYLIENRFPIPCHQCVVMENGNLICVAMLATAPTLTILKCVVIIYYNDLSASHK